MAMGIQTRREAINPAREMYCAGGRRGRSLASVPPIVAAKKALYELALGSLPLRQFSGVDEMAARVDAHIDELGRLITQDTTQIPR